MGSDRVRFPARLSFCFRLIDTDVLTAFGRRGDVLQENERRVVAHDDVQRLRRFQDHPGRDQERRRVRDDPRDFSADRRKEGREGEDLQRVFEKVQ